MNNIFIPAVKPEDWKQFLAEPDKQWRTGYSAKTLAYCWQEASGFPACVKKVFRMSDFELFKDPKLLIAIPEYKVPLPSGKRSSQNDIFILAKGDGHLISIVVEGKVSESFDKIINDWIKDDEGGKRKRLQFLLNKLQLNNDQIGGIRYQLLHRTVSAIILAEQFTAKDALMLVHSFSKNNEGFADYEKFSSLFSLKAKPNSILFAKKIAGVNLYLGWVKGDTKYLRK